MNPVSENEWLARFVVYKRWVRSDLTVRQDAFIPDPDLELSVTRHLNLTEKELWDCGVAAVGGPPRQLVGRADLLAKDVRGQELEVLSDPQPNNSNHAHIVNWPPAKDAQKIRALVLAASSKFVAKSQ